MENNLMWETIHSNRKIIKEDKLYGITDRNNKILVPCEYESVKIIGNYIGVLRNNLWGLVNRNNKIILSCEYENISCSGYKEIVDITKGNRYYMLNIKTKQKISNLYKRILMVDNELRRAFIDNKYILINKEGKELSSKYDNITNFSDGLARVSNDERWGYIDNTGKEVLPCIYNYAGDFNDGCAIIKIMGRYGHIDKNGMIYNMCI